MRISSVGLAYRNASYEVLYNAVRDAILSSHVHLESVDGGLCTAISVKYCMGKGVKDFDIFELLSICILYKVRFLSAATYRSRQL